MVSNNRPNMFSFYGVFVLAILLSVTLSVKSFSSNDIRTITNPNTGQLEITTTIFVDSSATPPEAI